MAVRIVTDSTCDLPHDLVEALGIIVVPAYVHFGDKTYRDGVDIETEELYRRLVEGPVHPTTSACSPGDFAAAYGEALQGGNEVVAITATGKMSALHKSALVARELLKERSRIEVVDSRSVSMGLGLIAIAAARKVQDGAGLVEVVETARNAAARTHMLAVLDTLKYALRGGRLKRTSVLIGSLIRVKPMITLRDGEVVSAGVTRTRARAIERLYEFVQLHTPVDDAAVVHNTTPDEAQSVAARIGGLMSGRQPAVATLGPALGVHGGPGVLVVAVLTGERGRDEEMPVGKKERKLSLPSIRTRRQ